MTDLELRHWLEDRVMAYSTFVGRSIAVADFLRGAVQLEEFQRVQQALRMLTEGLDELDAAIEKADAANGQREAVS